MKDGVALLLYGVVFSFAGWASWHWGNGYFTAGTTALLLLSFAIDNWNLRRQVRSLLAERERREQHERQRALHRLGQCLVAMRDARLRKPG